MDPARFFTSNPAAGKTIVPVFGAQYQTALSLLANRVVSDAQQLHVICDFDHTLTTMSSKQCHDVVVLNDEYDPEIHKQFKEICDRSYEEMKLPGGMAKLEYWWKRTNNLLIDQSGLTHAMFLRGMKVCEKDMRLRDRTRDLVTLCRDAAVPFVITSAGITNVISETLAAHGISTHHDDHFHIDANILEFHPTDGRLHRIMPESPVHSNAKRFVYKRAAHIFRSSSSDVAGAGSSSSSSSSSSAIVFAEVVNTAATAGHGNRDDDDFFVPTPRHGTPEVVPPAPAAAAAQAPPAPPAQPAHLSAMLANDGSEDAPEPPRGVAAIVLGDREGDFEVLKDGSDATLFRVGFAMDAARADALVAADCCDVVLVGAEASMEPVLELLQAIVALRDAARAERTVARAAKWDAYYHRAPAGTDTDTDTGRGGGNAVPPWESDAPFEGLVEFLAGRDAAMDVVELGCGSSATAVWLAESGHRVTAVDVSLPGLRRAQARPQAPGVVQWMLADLLSPSLFVAPHPVFVAPAPSSSSSSSPSPSPSSSADDDSSPGPAALRALPRGAFDLVFDMQCFHVLREGSAADEAHAARVIADLLRPGGAAVVVVGACPPGGGPEVPAGGPAVAGPPRLTRDDLVRPLTACGLALETIALTRFNPTPHYASLPGGPPEAWVAVFRKA